MTEKPRVYVDQISEDIHTGEQKGLGFHIHFDGEEATVLFLPGVGISRPLQLDAFQAKLRELAEALMVAAQSHECISVHHHFWGRD